MGVDHHRRTLNGLPLEKTRCQGLGECGARGGVARFGASEAECSQDRPDYRGIRHQREPRRAPPAVWA